MDSLLTLGDTKGLKPADKEACFPLPVALSMDFLVGRVEVWCRNNGKSLVTFFCLLDPLCWNSYFIMGAL